MSGPICDACREPLRWGFDAEKEGMPLWRESSANAPSKMLEAQRDGWKILWQGFRYCNCGGRAA